MNGNDDTLTMTDFREHVVTAFHSAQRPSMHFDNTRQVLSVDLFHTTNSKI
ncbi:hypothetical protein CfE428DRAFT_5626 [Chthoniobacter flavus Ellin428]|uniref:Uncharacterized protein n=1 Tax=Chthoniobacter flavus Ellin428 TaxID=497964 RepID=B4D9N6_9BACT|nr:hypothetical protein CfE428DRAFT_5626 [Chthoniobacter flavus Ellin428]TCO93360.1 hypothetical protein EV701_10464 [Chthoniobacter flavus]